jgi:hypothetical protein
MAKTKRRTAENEADIGNVEAWAEIFRDILHLIPGDHAELLALVAKNENEAAEKAKGGGLQVFDASDVEFDLRHWNAIMRLRSLVVQVFTRRIANNHSRPDAAAILLALHPYGHGSRCLGDYLPPEPKTRA